MGGVVVISEYSGQWPLMFATEAEDLRAVFNPDPVEIEHVGSTAVPGMGAKPVVDILLGAASLESIERRIDSLVSRGYRYVPEFEAQLPQRRYFVRPAQGDALFHLHAVERGGAFWREQISFRDVLRTNREVFDDYLRLKRNLAMTFRTGRDAYTDAKAPFIRAVIDGEFGGTANLALESPRAELAASYRELIREFADRGEKLVPFILEVPNEPFSEFLRQLDAWSRGQDLPAGFVPHSTFWLVCDGAEVVGVSNLRHGLTDKLKVDGGNIGYGVRPSARGRGFAKVLLRGTLDRARDLGMAEAWLTCAKDNHPSANTIVRNGGKLVSEAFIESRGEIVQSYRIDLAGTFTDGQTRK